ncbi:MAG: MATE family efflux transporter [Clostridia bacterium]|nr:MATE family efflux transporter [Clostridia bacterium]
MKEENILGTEKIGKLIRKFSIPCIISMLVNSLYNIVDQIFVGQGVGYLGNGATNIIFPLVMVCLAISLMIGDGASAFLSLKLGEKKEKEAAKGVGNGVILSIIFPLILSAICIIFLPKLIYLFGCTKELEPYALEYGYVIVLGFVFSTVGIALNSLIRADGNPKYSMTTMIVGAVVNTLLDPLFIFVFGMGVKGAAIATVISQALTALLNVLYIRKIKSISLNKESFKLQGKIVSKICLLGVSSFINEISIVAVMACENNMLKYCGENSRFGPEIPITVLGIVMKMSQILMSIILGIAIGAQPILGYNYGARKLDRVKKTLKTVLIVSSIVGVIAFILFQSIPEKLISVFGQGNELYNEFACMAFRIYLMLCAFYGIQIPAGIFFQSIGKSFKSAIISLSRQVLFLIPAILILGFTFGIDGILYAGPLADGIAIVISTLLLIFEVKNLGKSKAVDEKLVENEVNSISEIKEHIVITISREYGSGGRYIGKLLANKLGIKVYDREIVDKVAKETGLSKEYIENYEQKRTNTDTINEVFVAEELGNEDELFVAESNVIKQLAKENSCVIIGRCADYILKEQKDIVNVFVYNSFEEKVKRVVDIYKIKENDARKEIKRINKQRAVHYKHYTGNEWGKLENYDVCINSDFMGVESAANVLYTIIKEKIKKTNVENV